MDLPWVFLFLAGVFVSVYAVLIGGAMFLALPVFQILFPDMALGTLLGSIKVGSLFRGFTSVAVTFKRVNLRGVGILVILPALIGSVGGALFVARASQLWILPAVGIAILASEQGKWIHDHVSRPLVSLAALLVGLYGGVIGAGVIIMIMALLRTVFAADSSIAQVRIDAILVEFGMGVCAVFTLWASGSLSGLAWLPWSLGCAVGALWVGAYSS